VGGLATDQLLVKRRRSWGGIPPRCWGADHEEAKAQEGQVGHEDINNDSVTQIDFHEDERPEDDKRHRAEVS